MMTYIIRRLLYALPILLGVNLITFTLFFIVNTPDDMARMHLGQKHVSHVAVQRWKKTHGYDQPLFYNAEARASFTHKMTQTLFWQKSLSLFTFHFGRSDQGRMISRDIKERMWPSLALAIPTLIIGLAFNISFALLLAFFRGSYLDHWGVLLCVLLMSVSSLFYIIGGQYLLGKLMRLLPISGYQPGWASFKFLVLPVVIGIISGIGSGTRWYRTIVLEELSKAYVRTARSKGIAERIVLFRHVLRNALIPILTGVVVILPMLFLGSLIMESFFGIPGLGSYTIDAIAAQDFSIVRAMVFLGTVLYLIGLLLTDISYTWADPRVRLT